MAKADPLLSLDIPDPTDFPPTAIAPGLRQLDSALRCDICRDLFEAPVVLRCGHCFCSLCIRSALSTKQECPSCLKSADEGHLRINPAMEEAVASWKEARAFVLRLSREEEQRVGQAKFHSMPETPKIGVKSEKKHKRRVHPETPQTAGPSRKRLGQISKEYNSDTWSDDDFAVTIVPSSDPVEEDVIPFPDDILVECPLCQRRVRIETINDHIDKGCPSASLEADSPNERRSRKAEWSKILDGARKNDKGKAKQKSASPMGPDPLPKVAYTVLKDRQLKDLLVANKLPVSGDRGAWIARHQRWVMIYNANLDKSESQRKTVHELRTDLKKWEEDRKTKKSTVEDLATYQKSHRTEFAKLVEIARPKKRKRNDGDESPEPSNPSNPSTILRHSSPDVLTVDSE